MKKLICVLISILSLSVTVFGSETAPIDVEQKNINGIEYIIKTYETAVATKSETLIEEDFEKDGFLFSYETVEAIENEGAITKDIVEEATVESETDALENIIGLFPTTKPYDLDGFKGELILDTNSIVTEAKGYTTSYYTVSTTREIPGLMYPDPSFVPQTATKNNTTLPLTDVRFDVMATGLSGDSLVPTEYKAVGTYSKSFSNQVPTGFVSKAIYTGEVSKTEVDTITYIITYVGAEIDKGIPMHLLVISILGGLALLSGLGFLVFLYFKSKKGVEIYNFIDEEYFCLGHQSIDAKKPVIDLNEFQEMIQSHSFRFILDKKTTKALFGRSISVTLKDVTVKHMVKKRNEEYEFELDLGGVLDVE